MARQLRVEYEGAIYHVTCRMLGDVKSRLFIDDADRDRFLQSMSERVDQYNIRLYMYVLMNNHFHLVFETPSANCARFMQSLLTSYTVYYNLRHKRHGHLFDGRYKAKLVDGDEYLMSLSRYVHLNPVKVKGMESKSLKEKRKYLRGYIWSTYPGYIGKRKRLSYVEYSPVLAQSGGGRKQRSVRYRLYVESGLADNDEEFMGIMKESPRSIGADDFRKKIDKLYERRFKGYNKPEDVSFRHMTGALSSDLVIKVVAEEFNVDVEELYRRRRNSPLRAIAARCLIKYAGYRQREVAECLNVRTGASVSTQISRIKMLLQKDKKLRILLRKVETRLDEQRK